MPLTALLANTLWSASNLPAAWRFHRAARNPAAAQLHKLARFLRQNAKTAFGKAHEFDRLRTYKDFARYVPLGDYDAFVPWLDRVRQGEPNVLTNEPVTHLVPTSGSTAARKLIPFTAGLQREFHSAIGPWLLALQRRFPGLSAGSAYWSVTPPLPISPQEQSLVPIGFDSDTEYLGGARRRLAQAVMAVPSSVQRSKTIEEFRFQTLLHLLRRRDLRLISVWHPSFLTLLLDALPGYWPALLDSIASGKQRGTGSMAKRARELRAADPSQPNALWPQLRVISCWGDGHAELGLRDLQRRFPTACIQPKGLLATEAVVTFPFAGRHLLAVTSHFFEFLDDHGGIRMAHELENGEEYEVIVTTSGGLCRYRLRDRVLVTGSWAQLPALRFVGRAGNISDHFGEKLSGAFVDAVVQEITRTLPALPRFALVAPDENPLGMRYTLYWEGQALPDLPTRLDDLLRKNPHYALCRDLGQLQAPAVYLISQKGYETFALRQLEDGKRLGDVKPTSLSSRAGWSKYFQGHYSGTVPPCRSPDCFEIQAQP